MNSLAHRQIRSEQAGTLVIMNEDRLAYDCGHCGRSVHAIVLYGRTHPGTVTLVQCPSCQQPSVRAASGSLFPYWVPQRDIKHLPPEVAKAWSEASSCALQRAWTASEIMCRKILMHISVDVLGSPAGKNFYFYIDELVNAGYIAPNLRVKVDLIRTRGNLAVHDLRSSTASESEATMEITAFLLRTVYELPNS